MEENWKTLAHIPNLKKKNEKKPINHDNILIEINLLI